MKKLLLIAAAPLALATPAFAADTATADLTMSSTVPQTCYIASNPTATTPAGTFTGTTNAPTATSNGNVVTWTSGNIINQTTAAAAWGDYGGANMDPVNGQKAVITFTAVCNFAGSQVTVSNANGGLKNQSGFATVGNFANAISYYTRVRWNGNNVNTSKFGPVNPGNGGGTFVAPGGTSGATTVALPTNANMSVELKLRAAHRADTNAPIASGDLASFPLLAGTYSDTMTLRFGANP
jgi:hypothetical protein